MTTPNPNAPAPEEAAGLGGFTAEARHDVLNPPVTDAEIANTKNFDAPGHVARRGVADAMDAHFEERKGQPLVPTKRPEV